MHLDTHVVVRLYLGDVQRLGAAARLLIDRSDVVVSPAVVLELEFLHEIGRLKPAATKVVEALAADIGLRVCELPFRTVVQHALKEAWSHDPFDRLIVANAKAADAQLVTADERIRERYARSVW